MKKLQREIYQVLANEIDWCLCSFCKYAIGSGSCCNSTIECHHPLYDKSWKFEQEANDALEDMGDCWGFRPSHPVSFVADIIGIMLQKGWDSASWWQDKESIWKVAGAKLEV